MRQYLGSLRGLWRLNRRSPWLLLMGLIVGGIQLALLTGLAKLPPSPTKVAVVDQARNAASSALVATLKTSAGAKVTLEGAASAAADLDTDKVDVEIVIPASLGSAGGPAPLLLRYKLASTGERALPALQAAVSAFNERAGNLKPALTFEPRPTSGQSLGFMDLLLPAVLTIVVIASAVVATSQFSQFRQKGVLRRIQATGISPAPFVLAFGTLLLASGLLQAVALLAIANSFYPLHVQVLPMLGLTALGLLVNVALGLAVGGFFRDANVTQAVTQVIFLQLIVAYIPSDTRPRVLGYLPAGLLTDGFHQVVIGSGGVSLGSAVAGLGVWAAVLLLLALRVFRWEEA